MRIYSSTRVFSIKRNTSSYSPPESSSTFDGFFRQRLDSLFRLLAFLTTIFIASAEKMAAVDEHEPTASTARATLIELASSRFGALTLAEQALFRAITAGEIAVFRDIREAPPNYVPKGDYVLRADLIAWLCTAPEAVKLIKGRVGISIMGARIKGTLDLSRAEVPFALHFMYCDFSDTIQLNSSRLDTLDLQRSSIPGLQADNLTVLNDLNLIEARVESGVLIRGSKIGGDLLCPRSLFTGGRGVALNMEAALVHRPPWNRLDSEYRDDRGGLGARREETGQLIRMAMHFFITLFKLVVFLSPLKLMRFLRVKADSQDFYRYWKRFRHLPPCQQ